VSGGAARWDGCHCAGHIACLQVYELLGRVKAPQLLVVNACPPCQRKIFSTKSPNSGSGEARLVGPPDWESGEAEFGARPTGGRARRSLWTPPDSGSGGAEVVGPPDWGSGEAELVCALGVGRGPLERSVVMHLFLWALHN